MGTMLKSWWTGAKAGMAWLTRRAATEEEAYLSRSVDIADLERRLRHVERRWALGRLPNGL